MDANTVADGILLAVSRLSLYIALCCAVVLVVRIAWWVLSDWRDARRTKRAARLAKRPMKPVSLESYLGMRGH